MTGIQRLVQSLWKDRTLDFVCAKNAKEQTVQNKALNNVVTPNWTINNMVTPNWTVNNVGTLTEAAV